MLWPAIVACCYNIGFFLVLVYLMATFRLPIRSTNPLSKGQTNPTSFPAWEWHDATNLHSSHWAYPRASISLLCLRLFLLVIFVFVIAFQAFGPESIAYRLHPWFLTQFTNWTFVVFAAHAILGVSVSAKGLARSTNVTAYDGLDKVHAAVGVTVATCSLFLSVFYWLFVHHGRKLYLDSPFKHGINVVLLLGELLVSKTPVTTSWVLFPLCFGTAYTAFMWVWWAVSDRWTYSVLDFRVPGNLLHYVALPWMLLGAFGFIYGWASLRERLARRLQAQKYTSLAVEPEEAREAWVSGRNQAVPSMELAPL